MYGPRVPYLRMSRARTYPVTAYLSEEEHDRFVRAARSEGESQSLVARRWIVAALPKERS